VEFQPAKGTQLAQIIPFGRGADGQTSGQAAAQIGVSLARKGA